MIGFSIFAAAFVRPAFAQAGLAPATHITTKSAELAGWKVAL